MKHFAFLVFLLLLLAGRGQGQTSGNPGPMSPSSLAPQSWSIPTQRIGPDDLLTISVADCPELTRNFRVQGDGSLTLPLLHENIPANNKLPQEIESAIREALIKEQLLVQPVVSVSVFEYRSLPVSVLGAVRRPITFQAAGEVTLLDALTRADGLSQDAGSEIIVSRPSASADREGALLQRIPVKGLIDEANASLNIRLFGGEEIRVPSAGRVYVIGNVKKTGVFPVQDASDTTVLKMLALSEGLLPYSNKEAFIYRREAGKNDRDEIPVELTRIIQHKSPDIPLHSNDILYIPDSKGKRLTAETIKTLTGFGVSTMTGLLVWR